MALLLDNLFLSTSDFKEFTDLTKTMLNDVPKMEKYIREAQVSEVRKFLGDELYLKMVVEYGVTGAFTTQRYIDLWEGVDYTISSVQKRLHGLKVAHIYYTLSRIINDNAFNVTRFGNKDLQDGSSVSSTIGVTQSKANAARSSGLLYQNEAQTYLEAYSSTYTEWPDSSISPVRTGIQMMKI